MVETRNIPRKTSNAAEMPRWDASKAAADDLPCEDPPAVEHSELGFLEDLVFIGGSPSGPGFGVKLAGNAW
jgi:hypothetical protein